MPPRPSKGKRGGHRSRLVRRLRRTHDNLNADADIRGACAGIAPAGDAGIPPMPNADAETAEEVPMTNNDALVGLSSSQRVTFGKATHAIQSYWFVEKFTGQLADLCSNKIWIDRLVAQPMASCTIAFCERCGKIAPDSEDKDTHFSIHSIVIDTHQRLYEDLQTLIVKEKRSITFKYYRRCRRLRGIDKNGDIIADDRADTGFESEYNRRR